MADYLPRSVDPLIEELLEDVPAVMIVGPRASGKTTTAARLASMRDELGDRFATGVVLHTGPHAFRLSDRIVAAPICTLWS